MSEDLQLVPSPEAAAPGLRVNDEATASPQFFAGFAGAGTKRLTDEQIKILAAPVVETQVEVKGNGIVFLPWVHYNARLNAAFGQGNHAMVPRSPARVIGKSTVTYHGALIAEGRFMSESTGECEFYENGDMTYASALEGAKSDCITRCCKTFGTAMELWDASYQQVWLAKYALRAWLPKDGNYKAKFVYWRKDRVTPWQVEKAGSRIENGVGGPVAAGPKASSSSRSESQSTSKTSENAGTDIGPRDIPGDHDDTSQSDDIRDLEGLVDATGWNPTRTKNTFLKYFKRLPNEFTKAQFQAAATMLMAFKAGGVEKFREAVGLLQAEGVIENGVAE